MRALIRLAQSEGGPLTVRAIAQAEGISLKYLERVMVVLKAEGYVRSMVGAKGGYCLAQPPSQVVCGAVIGLFAHRASGAAQRNGQSESVVAEGTDGGIESLWQRTNQAVGRVLNQTTIADLLPATDAAPSASVVRAYLSDCEAGYMFYI